MTRSLRSRKVIVSHVFPPIPDRRWDYCAYHDGDEELTHLYGYGATASEAVAAHAARIEEESPQ